MMVPGTVQNGQIDVKDKAGKTTTFKLTPATKILRGKIAAAVGDIKIGERIVVIGVLEAKPAGGSATTQPGAAPARMMTAREVRLAPADRPESLPLRRNQYVVRGLSRSGCTFR